MKIPGLRTCVVRRLLSGSTLVLAIHFLAACGVSTDTTPDFVRPPGQVLLTTIDRGSVDAVQWVTEIVAQDGKNCVQSVVGVHAMGMECEFQTALSLPVNVEVIGNRTIMIVDGAVSPAVRELRLVTKDQSLSRSVLISAVGTSRYFGFGIAPDQIVDLVALDGQGHSIYSAGEKIRSASLGSEEISGPPPSRPTER